MGTVLYPKASTKSELFSLKKLSQTASHHYLAKVASEHLAKEHQIEVDHGKEEDGKEGEEEARSTNPLPRKRGRSRASCNTGKKLKMDNNHNDGQKLAVEGGVQAHVVIARSSNSK